MKKTTITFLFLAVGSVNAAPAKLDPSLVVDTYINAWNKHDKGAISQHFSENVSWYDLPSDTVINGKDKVSAEIITAFMGQVPDMYWVKSGDVFISNNTVVFEWTYGGTFNGSWGDTMIKDKRFSINGISSTTIDGEGKIVRQKDYYDLSSFMRSLGVVK